MPKLFNYKKIILEYCSYQHLNTDQIFLFLKKYFKKISLSTVYRNIQELVTSWELKEVLVLKGKTYYERNIGFHAHIIDEDKEIIKDISLPNLDFWTLPSNFDPKKVNLIIYGDFKS